MNANIAESKSPHLLIWIAGIAVILFSAAGIAAIMGWIPTSMGRSTESAAVPATANGKPAPTAASSATSQNHANSPARTPARVAERAPDRAPARVHCADCGVVESTREVTSKGSGSGVGAVGGAVVGGLLGNQVGSGRGNTVATASGAVGGAVAGNEVEKRVKTTTAYEVTVRLEDGSSRVVNEGKASPWHTGDRVKIVGGELQPNP